MQLLQVFGCLALLLLTHRSRSSVLPASPISALSRSTARPTAIISIRKEESRSAFARRSEMAGNDTRRWEFVPFDTRIIPILEDRYYMNISVRWRLYRLEPDTDPAFQAPRGEVSRAVRALSNMFVENPAGAGMVNDVIHKDGFVWFFRKSYSSGNITNAVVLHIGRPSSRATTYPSLKYLPWFSELYIYLIFLTMYEGLVGASNGSTNGSLGGMMVLEMEDERKDMIPLLEFRIMTWPWK
ncbi:hypothetical protein BJ508DRAFT_81939 [Ascobolus immersus RN42]|uniref:Uncharacterized protein n=1 Tax=Ascobolus immersus RN42 TaxID=1160509 RepID=A0A3N4HFY1_ASCIM|nr:hypothetical protein BJ508DRAFT_81939 [Ascobolus immersus RN42]